MLPGAIVPGSWSNEEGTEMSGRRWRTPKPGIFVLDLIIFVVVGAFLGTGIYNPDSLQAALAAGVS
jgi:hypothetical protein